MNPANLIAALALTLAVTTLAAAAPAYAATSPSTKVHCIVFTSSAKNVRGTYHFAEDVEIPEDQNSASSEIEIFHSAKFSYKAAVIQHDDVIAPKNSLLSLSIVRRATKKILANTTVIWNRQTSTGELAGITRVIVTSGEAEPGLDTQFLCDARTKH